jgi:cysteine desulfurase / selenocysteine lyase
MEVSYKHLFPQAQEVTYLDTAAEGLPAPGCARAFQQYCSDKEAGTPGRKAFFQAEEEALELAARLLGTDRANVAFLSSASEALYVLSSSLHWSPGDEVIISDTEFPSNVLPWLRLRQYGVRVIVIPADAGVVGSERVAEQISPRTRLVSLSLVSYKTGAYLTGLPALAAEAKRAGAMLCVDATQALGRCPVRLDGIDYLISSSFKWLMGPHGLGLVYLSPAGRERLDPASLGWYSVTNTFADDRFERYTLKPGAACLSAGMPNFPSQYALRESLRMVLNVSVDRIFQELRPVVEHLRLGFERLGCELLTPAGPEYASGIVSFAHSAADAIGVTLEREGIIVWAGDGRVRASVHLYNDLNDAERCLVGLETVLRSACA